MVKLGFIGVCILFWRNFALKHRLWVLTNTSSLNLYFEEEEQQKTTNFHLKVVKLYSQKYHKKIAHAFNVMVTVRPLLFYLLFYRFFRDKLGLEDEIKIKIKLIRTIFQLNLNRRKHENSVFTILIQLENGPNEFYPFLPIKMAMHHQKLSLRVS